MSDTASAEQIPQTDAQVEQPVEGKDKKKDHSYTYWVKNQPDFYGKNNYDIQPKKVDETEVQTLKA